MECQKKIAVLNDFSGFGRCSLTVALPVLSAMGVQCCPAPTAIYSNHTGYDSFYRVDFSAHLPDYFAQWEKLGLRFDGILIGFLGGAAQAALAEDFLDRFAAPETLVVLDPAMGDDGAYYPGCGDALAGGLRRLAARADILTPNLTEAAFLAGVDYDPAPDDGALEELARRLLALGAGRVVLSGLERGETLGNYVRSADGAHWIAERRTGHTRAGTGDVFASIVAGGVVRGQTLTQAVELAASFIARTIAHTDALRTPPQDGVCFEPFLAELAEKAGIIR